jgi:hypothetical protein
MNAREEIAGLPSDAARAALQDMRAGALLDLCELLISYGISTREAVFRGDNLEAGVCLRRARLTLIETLATYRDLAPNEAAAILNGKEPGAESKTQKRGRPPDG